MLEALSPALIFVGALVTHFFDVHLQRFFVATGVENTPEMFQFIVTVSLTVNVRGCFKVTVRWVFS